MGKTRLLSRRRILSMPVSTAAVVMMMAMEMATFLLVESYNVSITYVETAVAKGAVCLDGSPPAYHHAPGFGAGANSWLVQIEGGGWCNSVSNCLARKNTRLGSSKKMSTVLAFSGILSNQKKFNPDFYDWNKVKIRYCDGSSFTGDVDTVDQSTGLHYRGAKVFLAVIEELLAKGMSNAEKAVLSGCSAGGLASILHCDSFHSLLPTSAKVKCFSDAGYFINKDDISGVDRIKEFYSGVIATHGSAKNLPPLCTSRLSPDMCFFPQNMAQQIQTPLFILNAAYDSWQIKNILAPGSSDPHGTWHKCKHDIKKCSPSQIKIMQDYRLEFLRALDEGGNFSSRGFFIDSCYAHCQTETQETWFTTSSPVLLNTTIASAMGDWFYDRREFRKIDCPYPCNPTCQNRIFR